MFFRNTGLALLLSTLIFTQNSFTTAQNLRINEDSTSTPVHYHAVYQIQGVPTAHKVIETEYSDAHDESYIVLPTSDFERKIHLPENGNFDLTMVVNGGRFDVVIDGRIYGSYPYMHEESVAPASGIPMQETESPVISQTASFSTETSSIPESQRHTVLYSVLACISVGLIFAFIAVIVALTKVQRNNKSNVAAQTTTEEESDEDASTTTESEASSESEESIPEEIEIEQATEDNEQQDVAVVTV
jgi:guanyl-specific ribonuclease Sa